MRASIRWGVSLLVLLLALSAGCLATDTDAESSAPFVEPTQESKDRLPCGGARLLFFLSFFLTYPRRHSSSHCQTHCTLLGVCVHDLTMPLLRGQHAQWTRNVGTVCAMSPNGCVPRAGRTPRAIMRASRRSLRSSTASSSATGVADGCIFASSGLALSSCFSASAVLSSSLPCALWTTVTSAQSFSGHSASS